MKTTHAVAALLAAASITLAGCADNDPNQAAEERFNDTDVAFAQNMIPHHQQAIEMAELAESRATSPEVKQLAADIESAQGPEIETMSGWLEAWGEDVPDDDMGGMDHGSDDMPGMMTEGDMDDLEAASGAGFDQMFLTMMIEHHEGAIEMAQTEQAEGENPDALALAERIESDQKAEIQTMEALLRS